MLLQLVYNGKVIYEGSSGCVPPARATVTFKAKYHAPGARVGALTYAVVTDDPPEFNFYENDEVVVVLSVTIAELDDPKSENLENGKD